eukprot:CAMPEP_0202695918 /NCGR_PEP_ID=MMETSP1385-20130828/9355_1 /ASSEMBLY_ACC=CAM_ASM_000861 /TAXON_ID=933848 /ORGANISM="Elphidium margaritaceum" /LENGTH=307 /DNA_ID=CAMNT_0049352003 /DNA_START=215 /DNA_END=1138 /DNA_ORIENTATION=-
MLRRSQSFSQDTFYRTRSGNSVQHRFQIHGDFTISHNLCDLEGRHPQSLPCGITLNIGGIGAATSVDGHHSQTSRTQSMSVSGRQHGRNKTVIASATPPTTPQRPEPSLSPMQSPACCQTQTPSKVNVTNGTHRRASMTPPQIVMTPTTMSYDQHIEGNNCNTNAEPDDNEIDNDDDDDESISDLSDIAPNHEQQKPEQQRNNEDRKSEDCSYDLDDMETLQFAPSTVATSVRSNTESDSESDSEATTDSQEDENTDTSAEQDDEANKASNLLNAQKRDSWDKQEMDKLEYEMLREMRRLSVTNMDV